MAVVSSSSPGSASFTSRQRIVTALERHVVRNVTGIFQYCFLPIHHTARLTQLLRQRTVGLFLKLGLITGPPFGHPCPRRP